MPSTYDTARVAANVLKMELLSRRTGGSPGTVDSARLDALFEAYAADHDTVFVHAGLSDVAAAFDRDPYRFLVERLTAHFESVLVPGFTTSFVDSGIYHRRYSRPEFGTFAELFLEEAEYRTHDPIHSIMVKGPYRFGDCDHTDSFGDAGCWARLDRDDVLYLNVGTDWLRSTQFHYLEQRYDVPYVDVVPYEGVVYHDDTTFTAVTQYNHRDVIVRKFNRRKLERLLVRRHVVDAYDLNGLAVRFFRAGELRTALDEHLRRDPYFLIT